MVASSGSKLPHDLDNYISVPRRDDKWSLDEEWRSHASALTLWLGGLPWTTHSLLHICRHSPCDTRSLLAGVKSDHSDSTTVDYDLLSGLAPDLDQTRPDLCLPCITLTHSNSKNASISFMDKHPCKQKLVQRSDCHIGMLHWFCTLV